MSSESIDSSIDQSKNTIRTKLSEELKTHQEIFKNGGLIDDFKKFDKTSGIKSLEALDHFQKGKQEVNNTLLAIAEKGHLLAKNKVEKKSVMENSALIENVQELAGSLKSSLNNYKENLREMAAFEQEHHLLQNSLVLLDEKEKKFQEVQSPELKIDYEDTLELNLEKFCTLKKTLTNNQTLPEAFKNKILDEVDKEIQQLENKKIDFQMKTFIEESDLKLGKFFKVKNGTIELTEKGAEKYVLEFTSNQYFLKDRETNEKVGFNESNLQNLKILAEKLANTKEPIRNDIESKTSHELCKNFYLGKKLYTDSTSLLIEHYTKPETYEPKSKELKEKARLALVEFIEKDSQNPEFAKNERLATKRNELLIEAQKLLDEIDGKEVEFPEKTIDTWGKTLQENCRKILDKILVKKGTPNEHFLAILEYPKDDEVIRKIILENLHVLTKQDKEMFGDKKTPEIEIKDSHPFHLSMILRSIGVPLDFTINKGTIKNLGQLIDLEKQNLLTGIPINGIRPHYDDEFLLSLLNNEKDTDPEKVIGKNIFEKIIKRKDIVQSVLHEILDDDLPKKEEPGPELNEYLKKNVALREITSHKGTCYNIHAADVLIEETTITDEEKKAVSEKVFKSIQKRFLATLNTPVEKRNMLYLKEKTVIIGHALEYYQKHKDQLPSEQKTFFNTIKRELPKLMKELEDLGSDHYQSDIPVPASHLFEALQLMKK